MVFFEIKRRPISTIPVIGSRFPCYGFEIPCSDWENSLFGFLGNFFAKSLQYRAYSLRVSEKNSEDLKNSLLFSLIAGPRECRFPSRRVHGHNSRKVTAGGNGR
jgi:hypothetical protein